MPARPGTKYWRAQAAKAKALAELMTDEDSKWRLERIAADYDKLAQRAEALKAKTGLSIASRPRLGVGTPHLVVSSGRCK